MVKVIITGGMGSGKSSAVEILRRKLDGFTFDSADDFIDGLFTYDEDFQNMVFNMFGTKDKKAISKYIFSNTANKLIVDKYNANCVAYLENWLIYHAASFENVVLEIPLYFEILTSNAVFSVLRENFIVVNVDANIYTRIERVEERSKKTHTHWDKSNIQYAFDMQFKDKYRNALSDIVFDNSGTAEQLEQVIDSCIFKEYFENSKALSFPLEDFFKPTVNKINNNILRVVGRAYQNVNRTYHNLNHINFMDDILSVSKAPFKNSVALQLAILFHDYCYDVHSKSNEEDSVCEMYEILNIFQPQLLEEYLAEVELAEIMIMATVGHQMPSKDEYEHLLEDIPDAKEMIAAFLDLDIYVFTNSHFYLFDDAVREEYSEIPDNVFYPARKEVLERFLEREKLFISETFGCDEAEKISRKNLQSAIDKCEAWK